MSNNTFKVMKFQKKAIYSIVATRKEWVILESIQNDDPK